MAKKPLPTPEELRQLLRYEADTGKMFWIEQKPENFQDGKYSRERKCSMWNGSYAGKEAFATQHGEGYRVGAVGGRMILAHRVAYTLYHGQWPKGDIDHINGNRTDNRIINLRDVSRSENLRNAACRSNNTSGHTGVRWNKKDKKWVAFATVGGSRTHLGYFDNRADACAARSEFNKNNGFTRRHGKPAVIKSKEQSWH